MTKPILVFGYGNLSRADDAVGPLLLAHLEQHADLTQIELLTDFQLQIEHAMDLYDRDCVIFVDASVACTEAFDFKALTPSKDRSYTTHAMSPSALLQVFSQISQQPPPPCFLLSIQANHFELGDPVSASTSTHLAQACEFALTLLQRPSAEILQMARQHAQPAVSML